MPTLLLTGSNRGIGLEFARQYAERAWQVVATCRKPEKADVLQILRDQFPDRLQINQLDVTDQLATETLCKSLQEGGVAIDLLICNAGVLNARPFGYWKQKRFLDTINTNAVAPGMMVQAARPILSENAKIVFITSGIGSLSDPLMPEGPMDAYAISKAAMNMMAIRAAEKLRPQGIPLVAISPGWVRTDMGTKGAELSVGESVSSLIDTIQNVTMESSGRFLDRFGKALPW